MKLCRRCKIEYKDDYIFCPKCGTPHDSKQKAAKIPQVTNIISKIWNVILYFFGSILILSCVLSLKDDTLNSVIGIIFGLSLFKCFYTIIYDKFISIDEKYIKIARVFLPLAIFISLGFVTPAEEPQVDNNDINQNINQENSINDNSAILGGISCSNDCIEYKDIEMNKEYKLNYNIQNIDILVNTYNSENYEDSKLSIIVNNKQIYSVTDFTSNVKIFKFKEIYVVEYVQSQSQCGNVIDILIKSDGSLIKFSEENMDDVLIKEGNEIKPRVMKTEFIESSNSIIVYKEICSMCPNQSYQTGFKYTYLLENENLTFQSKEDVFCK